MSQRHEAKLLNKYTLHILFLTPKHAEIHETPGRPSCPTGTARGVLLTQQVSLGVTQGDGEGGGLEGWMPEGGEIVIGRRLQHNGPAERAAGPGRPVLTG